MKILTLFVCVISAFFSVGEAVCCGPNICDLYYGDWCCGVGRCNFFCCNCDGGCKHDNTFLFEPDFIEEKKVALSKFNQIDTNHDGFIDFEEALAYHHLDSDGKRGADNYIKKEFQKMDKNHNGRIDRAEFDGTLN